MANTQEYDLPASFRKVISVLVKDLGGPPYPRLEEIFFWQKDLLSLPGGAADWLSGGGKGEPRAYYIQRPDVAVTATNVPKIGFVPIPTRNGSANGVEIIYHAQRDSVTVISSSETPDVPADWHPLIAWKMAMNAAALDEGANYGYYQSGYQGRLARLIGEGLRGAGEAQEKIEEIDTDY